MVIAADKPFGPLPTTTASYSRREKGMSFGAACERLHSMRSPSYPECHAVSRTAAARTSAGRRGVNGLFCRRGTCVQIIPIALAQRAFQQLARGRVRQFIHKNISIRNLPLRESLGQKFVQFL